MGIRHIIHDSVDVAKWNSCISKSLNGIIYAYSWYLDIVCPEWDALVCGDYESVMPLTQNRKYGVDYLYQPYFTQQLGIFSSVKIDRNLVLEFIHAIPEKFKFIEINLNKYNCMLDLNGFQIRNNKTYELDLIPHYENIFRKYKKNTIRNIRKAIRNKITINKGLIPNLIFDFVEKFGNFPGLKKTHLKMLQVLIETAVKNKAGYMYGAYNHKNSLCALGFFIYSNNKACFILSVTSHEGKDLGAMFLLVDEFIKDFSGQNIILDFEGSNIAGIARFYDGFGATPFNYPTIKANKLPFPFKLLKN